MIYPIIKIFSVRLIFKYLIYMDIYIVIHSTFKHFNMFVYIKIYIMLYTIIYIKNVYIYNT